MVFLSAIHEPNNKKNLKTCNFSVGQSVDTDLILILRTFQQGLPGLLLYILSLQKYLFIFSLNVLQVSMENE